MKQIIKRIFPLFVFVFIFSESRAQSVGGTTSGATYYCSTTNSGFLTLAGYTGSILNWESSTDGGTIWNNIVNTTSNQTYFNLAQTTCYRAVVQNGAFPPDTSSISCITIYPESVGGAVGGGGTFCASSGPGSLLLTGYTGSILNWMYSTNGGASWTDIANTTNTETYTDVTVTTWFVAVVQSGPSCPSDTSAPAIFTIYPPTVPGSISGAANVCVTGNSGTLTLSGYTGNIIGWSYSTTGGASWIPISNTTDSQTYLNLTQTTAYHAIVQSGTCSADSTSDVLITVSPATVAGTLSGGGTFCGTPATGTLTLSGFTGSITGWEYSTTGGASWNPITDTMSTEAYTDLPSTTWYAAIIQSGGCPSDTSNIEIVNVYPQTVAGTIAADTSVCYGTNRDSLFLSGNVGNIIGWLSSTNNGLSWTAISDTNSFHVYSGLTTTTWFAAIVQSGVCEVDTTAPVVVTVFPQFAVSAGNDTSINTGQSLVLNGSGSGTPTWSPSAGLNSTGIFMPTATPETTTTYVLTVMDVNGCRNSDAVVVTVLRSSFNGKVSNLFTPNGDGINDSWYIEGIQNFPDNEVFVYNIYGNEVYTKKAYSNDWQGTYNGNDLPDGTYYFVIRFNEEPGNVLKGSVDILRKK